MNPSDFIPIRFRHSAFYDACLCAMMPHSASDFNVVVNYLATFPAEIDAIVSGLLFDGVDPDYIGDQDIDKINDLSLLRASFMVAGVNFTDSGSDGEAKRMVVPMILLAGASTDDPKLGEFGGFDPRQFCIYDSSFVEGLLALCVSTPAERKEKWPETVAELVAASADRDQQLKIVMRAFVENCGSDTSEEAIRALVVFE